MKKQITLIFALLLSTLLSANNISVTNIQLTKQNTTANYTNVKFDISWENSWRTSSAPNNWDAAWVFVKFKRFHGDYISASGATSTITQDYSGVADATSSGTTITVTSTALLRVGMPVNVTGTGAFAVGTVVTAIDINGVDFTVSATPTTNLITGDQVFGYGATITVISTVGLRVGMPISVAGGAGFFADGTVVTEIVDRENFKVSSAPYPDFTTNEVITGYSIWEHATLSTTDFIAPSGSTITPSGDGLGVFIYRDANGGPGTFTLHGVQLRWNYGLNRVLDNDLIDIQVYAIEMVYVSEGSFYVGTGGNEASSFTQANNTSGATVPFQITSTAPTLQGNHAGSSSLNLSARDMWDLTGTTTDNLAAGYPTGYTAFYCMKYELNQQQYVDFLNNITQTQATIRKYDKPTSNFRYEIIGSTIGNYSTANPNVACNFLSWADLTAYLDWSGLRPMTELEFEKACRGPLTPVPDEYAWGTSGIAGSLYTLTNSGASDEVIGTNYSTTVGNAAYDATTPTVPATDQGPLRVGIFAGTSGNTGRVTAGATYYGIMEMSGNLFEHPITMGNIEGRSFTGTHGDGLLDAYGDANVKFWPGNGVPGSGYRGSSYRGLVAYLEVSSRIHATVFINARGNTMGGRGVHSAP